MLYPIGGCETQPRIDVQNITLRNIESRGGFLPPGVIRCNASNPCTVNLENVDIRGWWEVFNWSFISEYVDGNVVDTYPDPGFGRKSERVFQLVGFENIVDFIGEATTAYE